MSFNSFRDNIPMGGEPTDTRQDVYYFEIHGEVAIAGNNELDAIEIFKSDIGSFILEVYKEEEVEVIPENTQQIYLFEVQGEVPVVGYNKEDATNLFHENARDYLADAFYNGDIEVKK